MITLRNSVSGDNIASFSNASFGGGTGNTKNFHYTSLAATPRRHMGGRMPGGAEMPSPPKLLPDASMGHPTYPMGEQIKKTADDWASDRLQEEMTLREASRYGMTEGRPGNTQPAAAGGMSQPEGGVTPMTSQMGE